MKYTHRLPGALSLNVGDEIVPAGWHLPRSTAYGVVVEIDEAKHRPTFYKVKVHGSDKVEKWQHGYAKLFEGDEPESDLVEKLRELVVTRQEELDAAETALEEAKSALRVVESLG